jgi:hypothetical protein
MILEFPVVTDRALRLQDILRKMWWRARSTGTQDTRPVFIFGAQRSGTGMLGECLGRSPECENLGESDDRAFVNFSLREPPVVEKLIAECPYKYLVFKPLKDSHRVHELLGLKATGKAIWAYRNYVDRINSAVRKFGRRPLEVFEAFRAGDHGRWQLQGISAKTSELLSRLDVDRLTESDGAALMWWLRNSLYFDQGLDREPRARLWSYDEFVVRPEPELRSLLEFLGAGYHDFMLRRVHARSLSKEPAPDLDPAVRDLCESLLGRLNAALSSRGPGQLAE